MQRGRGRGRGRNTDSARSTSGRGDRSRPRNTIAHRGRSRASIRRSARIAEILNNQLNNPSMQASTNLMANVSRTRGFASTSVRSRQPMGTNRRPRSNRPSTSTEDIQYAMDIVVQPPSTSSAGYAINGTIIVRLRTANVHADDANRDSYHLTALASLIPAGNSSGSSDPRALDRLLGGRRYVSVHPFSDDEADGSIAAMELDDPRGVGYMHFPDLSIHQAGTYRIRITLIRIANLDAPTISGGEHIQAIDSNPIVVQSSGSSSRAFEVNGSNDNNDDGGWHDTLREISMRQRSF